MYASRQRLSAPTEPQLLSTNACNDAAAPFMSSASNLSTPVLYSVPGLATDAQARPATQASSHLRGAMRAAWYMILMCASGRRGDVRAPACAVGGCPPAPAPR